MNPYAPDRRVVFPGLLAEVGRDSGEPRIYPQFGLLAYNDSSGTSPVSAPVRPAPGSQPPIPGYTDQDADILGRVIYGEATPHSAEEMAGIGWTAINRTRTRGQNFPRSLQDVLTQPLPGDPNRHQ